MGGQTPTPTLPVSVSKRSKRHHRSRTSAARSQTAPPAHIEQLTSRRCVDQSRGRRFRDAKAKQAAGEEGDAGLSARCHTQRSPLFIHRRSVRSSRVEQVHRVATPLHCRNKTGFPLQLVCVCPPHLHRHFLSSPSGLARFGRGARVGFCHNNHHHAARDPHRYHRSTVRSGGCSPITFRESAPTRTSI
ncbi:hypothetical protein HPB50_004079 [Hyalomma asiaticum]|uniref:Uncharacterized protein n=1 Tax=Hyalomma asiaticum TaxID=266040 RepID=A0ACB7T169_HYAAI|nr:hypothetical protein HPB50_004079 [Hyalomma asiaticum]